MKKSLLLAAIASSSVALADQVSSTYDDCIGRNVASFTLTLGDVAGTLTNNSSGSMFWNSGGESDITPAWTNTAAVDAMNQDLGLSLTATDVMDVSCTGNGGSIATMTLDFSNSVYSGYTGLVTLYFTVGQMAGPGPMTSITTTGISGATFQYATYGGDGFTDTATFSSGKGMSTLVKMTGTLEGDTLTISSTNGKNGFGMVALKGISTDAVPEPTTATLSLLALAGLAARRRRR